MTIETTLRECVTQDDRSPTEIARLAEVDRGYLYRWLAGSRGLGMAMAEKLAVFYGLELRPIPKRRRKAKQPGQ